MAELPWRKARKTVTFSDKVEVFLIPGKSERRAAFPALFRSEWIGLSQMKPLLTKPAELKTRSTPNTCDRNVTVKQLQTPKDLIDFYLKRTNKYLLTSTHLTKSKATMPCTQKINLSRDDPTAHALSCNPRRFFSETTFSREKVFPNKGQNSRTKSSSDHSPNPRDVIWLGNRPRGQLSDILAIYENNPSLVTTKPSRFLESSFVSPENRCKTDKKIKDTSVKFIPHFSRSTPALRTVQSAFPVVPDKKDVREENLSWKWPYLQ